MSIATMAAQLAALGRTLIPLIVPGAGPVIALAGKVADAIDDAKDIVGAKDQATIAKVSADLRARVNVHVDSTVDRLRNG